MPWKWYDSKVIKIEDQSPTTKRFWVEVDAEEVLDFKAGQFVTMDLPIHEKRTKRWRSYSIANAPNQSNILEFSIVFLEGGAGSKYFFEEVELGTIIKFKGPAGVFCLPDNIENDLVLICTGTGVVPFRSMLWDIYNNQKTHKNIHLIFGTRFASGILYREEFEELSKKIPGFKYSVALSREEELSLDSLPFPTVKGYIHPVYLEKYKEVKPDTHFYICGWKNMIDEARTNLKERLGYDKSQIHFELYG